MKNTNLISRSRLWNSAGFAILCLFFVLIGLINLTPFLDSKNALMDFGSFYASGLKIRNGENPYDANSEYIFEIDFARVGAGGKMINLNPPISVMIFELLANFDPHRSLVVWQISSVILYISSIFLLGSAYKQNMTPTKFIWAFMLAGFWHTIVLGQIYIVLLLFSVLGWIFLQRDKYVLAGVAIGFVVAIKPNFVLWPIFLLVAGYYASALTSILVSLAISLLPLLIYGVGIYTQWFEASALRLETLAMPGNNSIVGLTARFDNISIGVAISILASLALLILSKFQSSKFMEKSEYVSGLGIIASLLASPISWTGYSILMLPIFFSLKKWTPAVVIAAILLVIPFQIVLQLFQTSFTNFVIFGWLYGWAILSLLSALLKETVTTKNVQAI